jgi:hypothetical protein
MSGLGLTPGVACQQRVQRLGVIGRSEAFGHLGIPQAPHHAGQRPQMRWIIPVRAQEKECQIRRHAIDRGKILGWSKAGKNAQRLPEAGKDGMWYRDSSSETER